MALSDAELAEQERRASMAAAGIDVGPIDAAALIREVKRLKAENAELKAKLDSIEQDQIEARLREP